MDGFAFDGSRAGQRHDVTLKVVGTALAGAPWQGRVGPGEAVRIMTGAVMPDGLDTVVPQELAREQGDAVTRSPAGVLGRGDNRRKLGEDLMQGQPALRQGDRLGPAALGLVASLGIAQVPVWRRLKVAYFSTGNEILSLGEPPRAGAVYDSNRYTVFGLLTPPGRAGDRHGRGARRAGTTRGCVSRRRRVRPTRSSPAAASASARPTTPRP